MNTVNGRHRAQPVITVAEASVAAHSPATAPVQVLNCSRIGRQANPPGFRLSFGGWFRHH